MSKCPASYFLLLRPRRDGSWADLRFALSLGSLAAAQTGPGLLSIPHQPRFARTGASVTAHFAIHNEGDRELIVDQFTTSCSCAGVEREEEGKPVRVESLNVAGGAIAELFVRIAVNGAIGDNQFLQVFFHSNDPARPMGQVDIIIEQVTGGIFPSPRSARLWDSARGEAGLLKLWICSMLAP